MQDLLEEGTQDTSRLPCFFLRTVHAYNARIVYAGQGVEPFTSTKKLIRAA